MSIDITTEAAYQQEISSKHRPLTAVEQSWEEWMERPHQAGLKRALEEDLAPLDELGNWKPRRLTELTPALFPALFAAQQADVKLEPSIPPASPAAQVVHQDSQDTTDGTIASDDAIQDIFYEKDLLIISVNTELAASRAANDKLTEEICLVTAERDQALGDLTDLARAQEQQESIMNGMRRANTNVHSTLMKAVAEASQARRERDEVKSTLVRITNERDDGALKILVQEETITRLTAHGKYLEHRLAGNPELLAEHYALNVPIRHIQAVKRAGGKWGPAIGMSRRKWFAPPGMSLQPFCMWM
jgi:hypothetical protein